MKRSLLALCLGALLAQDAAAQARLKVDFDAKNVVADRLEGKWVLMPELAKRLFGSDQSTPIGKAASIEFKADAEVLNGLPDAFVRRFNKVVGGPIFMAGRMTLRGKEHPFLVVTHRGNPFLIYLRPKGQDPLGDAEMFNVFVAAAAERKNDVLLLGSESLPRPFTAFERAKPPAEK